MASSDVIVEITQREAKLVLKYGCPFPEQALLFEEAAKTRGISDIQIDGFWLQMIVGDLGHSIRKTKSASLQEELDSLCETFEWAIRHAS